MDLTAVPLADSVEGMGFLALILKADIVVKAVMLMLVAASVWCWAVIVDKSIRLVRLKQRSASFERAFWSGTALSELYRRLGRRDDHPMAMMFASAIEEWRDSRRTTEPSATQRLIERVERVMELTMERELERLRGNIPSLATIGSTAPFLGLFGTVWGIMRSFQAIAVTNNTTLAVVAPGIAEALLATALGLVAAIPAVVAYNKFTSDLERLGDRLASFAGELSIVLSREAESAQVR